LSVCIRCRYFKKFDVTPILSVITVFSLQKLHTARWFEPTVSKFLQPNFITFGELTLIDFIFIHACTIYNNEKSVTAYFFGFGWLVATPAASQQHKKIFLLATSTITSTSTKDSSTSTSTSTLHASTSTSTLKNVLKYNLSTSTSTKYNETACSLLLL